MVLRSQHQQLQGQFVELHNLVAKSQPLQEWRLEREAVEEMLETVKHAKLQVIATMHQFALEKIEAFNELQAYRSALREDTDAANITSQQDTLVQSEIASVPRPVVVPAAQRPQGQQPAFNPTCSSQVARALTLPSQQPVAYAPFLQPNYPCVDAPSLQSTYPCMDASSAAVVTSQMMPEAKAAFRGGEGNACAAASGMSLSSAPKTCRPVPMQRVHSLQCSPLIVTRAGTVTALCGRPSLAVEPSRPRRYVTTGASWTPASPIYHMRC